MCEAAEYNLSLPQLTAFLHQGMAALRALKDMGISHRDLKPANVFITHGGMLQVRIFITRPMMFH
jgi:serine/threonine protein kinase